MMARAMATRCFCPPDSWTPRSPTIVSYPCPNPLTNLCAFACSAAAMISASLASPSFP
ncbi:ABC transporter b family member 21 [Phtheirospermum japonicum]|uniref:ABC transporter b family member 21 n=1 Tax=Phtheirospermum japonicum TaxID=374723 RepID=A0A830CH21_9LAMI|nr:ABC transporter b family member 21 [Phtheirospermum japonicum]